MKETFKIGEVIIPPEEIKIEKMMSGTYETIPSGTKYLVDAKGRFVVLNGKFAGTVIFTEAKVDGYDIESITDLIYDRVVNEVNECMGYDQEEVEEEHGEYIKERIEELLMKLFC